MDAFIAYLEALYSLLSNFNVFGRVNTHGVTEDISNVFEIRCYPLVVLVSMSLIVSCGSSRLKMRYLEPYVRMLSKSSFPTSSTRVVANQRVFINWDSLSFGTISAVLAFLSTPPAGPTFVT